MYLKILALVIVISVFSIPTEAGKPYSSCTDHFGYDTSEMVPQNFKPGGHITLLGPEKIKISCSTSNDNHQFRSGDIVILEPDGTLTVKNVTGDKLSMIYSTQKKKITGINCPNNALIEMKVSDFQDLIKRQEKIRVKRERAELERRQRELKWYQKNKH